jgi:beta-galactosidase
LDDQPAVVTRKAGRGRITYIGGVLDVTLMQAAAQWMAKSADISSAFGPVPDGLEVSRRVGPNKTVYVLINFQPEKQTVILPRAMRSLLDHKDATRLDLTQYQVAVLSESNHR